MSPMGCLFAAAFVSITAVLCLDYFFTLTLFPLGVNQTMSVVALIACLTTTLVIARLKFKMRKSFQKVQAFKRPTPTRYRHTFRASLSRRE